MASEAGWRTPKSDAMEVGAQHHTSVQAAYRQLQVGEEKLGGAPSLFV